MPHALSRTCPMMLLVWFKRAVTNQRRLFELIGCKFEVAVFFTNEQVKKNGSGLILLNLVIATIISKDYVLDVS